MVVKEHYAVGWLDGWQVRTGSGTEVGIYLIREWRGERSNSGGGGDRAHIFT
jgi:hypothetical protein